MFADTAITASLAGRVSGVAVRDSIGWPPIAGPPPTPQTPPGCPRKTARLPRLRHRAGCYAVIGDGEREPIPSTTSCCRPRFIHPVRCTTGSIRPRPRSAFATAAATPWFKGYPSKPRMLRSPSYTVTYDLCPINKFDDRGGSCFDHPPGPDVRNRHLFELPKQGDHSTSVPGRTSRHCPIGAKAFPFIKTKDFTTSWCDFSRAWEVVRIPRRALSHVAMTGWNPLPHSALGMTCRRCSVPLRCAAKAPAPRAWRNRGLSCRMAPEKLEWVTTPRRWIKLLLADGVLELASLPLEGKPSRRVPAYPGRAMQ